MKNVTLKITGAYIKIYINEIIHLQIPYLKEITLQSWKQGNEWYCICFYNNGVELTETWYKDKDIWVEILKLWDENII